jgi:hypothetical protein
MGVEVIDIASLIVNLDVGMRVKKNRIVNLKGSNHNFSLVGLSIFQLSVRFARQV